MTFLTELKRRNVFRVAILYLVASWLILQVVDVGVSLLGLPTAVGRFIFLFLAVVFPLVLIFSWAYEITPEGVVRESGVDRSDAATYATAKRLDSVVIALLILAIGVTVVDRMIPESQVAERRSDQLNEDSIVSDAPVRDMSIAVLPFADLSPQADQGYFTDGLSDELLNVLVGVDGLRVSSRTSSFAFRDSSIGIPEIANELSVAHIVEGSVRKDGNRIRITARLIDAETDQRLWSDYYEREFVDIFAIQDEIANSIVQALSDQLGADSLPAVSVEATTDNLDAYEMYVVAKELYIRREDLPESLRLTRSAVGLDPSFAEGWELIAMLEAIAEDFSYGIWTAGVDHPAVAKEAASRAIELNPQLSMPLAVLGSLALRYDRDPVVALQYFDDSLNRSSKNATAWLWRGLLFKYSGYLDQAIADFEQCLRIDSAYFHCRSFMAESYLFKGMPEKALELHEESNEHIYGAASPSFVSLYVRRGQRETALEIADRKMRRMGAPVIEWIHAIENPDADHRIGLNKLLNWSEQIGGGMELPPQMLFSFNAHDEMLELGEMQRRMLWHPDAKEFRSTPQFKQIIRERGIILIWRSRGFPPMCRAIGDEDFECD